jgi:GNAT superfamily N-acetyltransferase
LAAKFRVRRATTRDLDVLVHQRHVMFEEMRPRTAREHRIGDASYRSWAASNMKKGKLRCFLALSEDGRPAAGGCVWLRPRQPAPGRKADFEPYLLSMYTEPEFRRLGLASMIVGEAEKWVKGKGYRRMSLHASPDGRKVYPKLGWKRTWEMAAEF